MGTNLFIAACVYICLPIVYFTMRNNTICKNNLILSVINGTASALGYTIAICLFAGIRERLALGNMPKWMEGFTGALITAGLMAVAFNGFNGLI